MNATTTQTQAPARRAEPREREYVLPATNIFATDAEYLLEIEMPGVSKEGLEVTIEGNQLTITGHKQTHEPEGALAYCESGLCDYRRAFELGADIDPAKIRAEMAQGILKLHLPKAEQAKARRIAIQG